MGRKFKWPFVAPANSNSTRRGEKRAASKRKTRNTSRAWFTKQVETQDGKCWFCNEEMGGDCTREHLVARALGGSNRPDNIVAAHGDCNSAAGHLTLVQKEALRRQGHSLGRLAVIDLAHKMRRADAEYAFWPRFEATEE